MIPAGFSERSKDAELIDGCDYSAIEYLDNLADLRRVNLYLGGARVLTQRLFPLIERLGRTRIRLLDVGTGSADIPRKIVNWSRSRGLKLEFVVIDVNEIAALEARRLVEDYPEIRVIRADGMNLPFKDRSFDFVLASLFLHHFDNGQAAKMIAGFARVAREGFIVNDLRRHPIPYYAIKILSRLLTQNRLVRNDSALSVLRGFTELDIGQISAGSRIDLQIFRHFPYRYILIGKP